jgi:hypothetical protein
MRLDWADLSGKGAFHRLNDVEELAKVAQKESPETALVLDRHSNKKKL